MAAPSTPISELRDGPDRPEGGVVVTMRISIRRWHADRRRRVQCRAMRTQWRPARISPRTLTLTATALILLSVAGVVFWYDQHAPPSPAAAGVAFLDTRLVWASRNSTCGWSPLPGWPVTFVCDRRFAGGCHEVGPNGEERPWWFVSGVRGDSPCKPVAGGGRLYVAADPDHSDGAFIALDLKDLASPARRKLWSFGGEPERKPVWVSRGPADVCPDGRVSGLAYGGGRLYAGVDRGGRGGGLAALDAADGKALYWMPTLGRVIGAPVLAAAPDGGRVILVACRGAAGVGVVEAFDAASGRVLWLSNQPLSPTGPPAEAAGVVVVGGVGEHDRPRMVALDLLGGAALWQFQSPHEEPGAGEEWDLTGDPPAVDGPPRRSLPPSADSPAGSSSR